LNATQFAFERESLAFISCCDLLTGVLVKRHQYHAEAAGRRLVWSTGMAVLAAHGVLLLILAGIVVSSPHAGEWIAEAVEAEFVGPGAPVAPTQFAQPAGEMWAAGTN
jgi:hypothetical protein